LAGVQVNTCATSRAGRIAGRNNSVTLVDPEIVHSAPDVFCERSFSRLKDEALANDVTTANANKKAQ
jgi:hypothetical protein